MIISVDLDDTLMHSDKSISDYTLKVFKLLQEQGHFVVINTARNFVGTIEIIKILQPDFTICNAGALILNKTMEVIHEAHINKDTTNEVVKNVLKYTNNISIQTNDILYTTNPSNNNVNAIYYDGRTNGYYFEAQKILPYKLDKEEALKIEKKYNLIYTS